MPRVYSIDGLIPVVDPTAFVHPSAVLHGCVVRRGALVGMNAVVNNNAEQELRWKQDNMLLYQDLTRRSAETMREVEALSAVEPNRKRIDIPGAIPLSELKKSHA